MLHLTTDRLAELADTPPTPAEVSHLAGCDACAVERDAFVVLAGMAHAERDAMGLPLTRWESIAAGLAQNASPGAGAIPAPGGPRAFAPRAVRWPLQIAAGLLLCAGGAMLGRASAGASALPGPASATPSALATAAASRIIGDSGSFASVDEARAAQARSAQTYEQAAAFLAQHDTSGGAGSPVAIRSRLAALDRVISATSEALREAPHDPVINDYYLTTIGQREATLRQLNTALPASLRLNSF